MVSANWRIDCTVNISLLFFVICYFMTLKVSFDDGVMWCNHHGLIVLPCCTVEQDYSWIEFHFKAKTRLHHTLHTIVKLTFCIPELSTKKVKKINENRIS